MSPRTSSTAGKNGKGKPAAAPRPARGGSTVAARRREARPGEPGHRQRYIAEAAYFKAEQRGFAQGGEWMTGSMQRRRSTPCWIRGQRLDGRQNHCRQRRQGEVEAGGETQVRLRPCRKPLPLPRSLPP
jgi:hypothetical protein